MDQFTQLSNTISLSMGTAWASGINLYATILTLGIMGVTGNMVLPEHLQILTNPMVIGASGLMFVTEFFADKIPGVDSGCVITSYSIHYTKLYDCANSRRGPSPTGYTCTGPEPRTNTTESSGKSCRSTERGDWSRANPC